MTERNDFLPAFERLVSVVHELREKCPWDKKQTFESLRHLTIEEAYELTDAILTKDYPEMKIELGDLLLHIIFYSRIAEEQSRFALSEVIHSQTEKLIRRHPHIYGDVQADTEEEVLKNWEQIKAEEKKSAAGKEQPKSRLAGVPDSLPPLIQAYRIQEKVSAIGFDWEDSSQVLDKINEELEELHAADNLTDKEEEMGDLLFSLINYCRFAGINPDDALSRTNLKFKQRFNFIEQKAYEKNQNLADMSIDEMEALWKESKREF